MAKQLYLENEFQRYRARVEYALADYDGSAEGSLSKNIRAVIADYERLKTIERTRRGTRNSVRARSVHVQGRPPLGYDVEKANGKYALRIIIPDHGYDGPEQAGCAAARVPRSAPRPENIHSSKHSTRPWRGIRDSRSRYLLYSGSSGSMKACKSDLKPLHARRPAKACAAMAAATLERNAFLW